ncbi:FHIPEP family type III secretion protein, partial [Rhizobium brockwellii]
FVLALMPGLPFVPFVVLGGLLAFGAWFIPRQVEAENMLRREQEEKKVVQSKELEKDSVKAVLRTSEIELALGKMVSTRLLG